MIYILIIVLSIHSNGKVATSTINVEFNSLKTCQQAGKSIVEQTNLDASLRVRSRGCYEK